MNDDRMQMSSGEDRAVVWTISFGDLLTLLVCFFLVLTPWEKLGKPANPQSSGVISDSGGGGADSGTRIAISSIKEGDGQTSDTPAVRVVSEIPLWVAGWNDGEATVELETLREEIAEVSGEAGPLTVTIRLCDSSARRDEVLESVTEVLSQAKLPETRVSVRLVGRACEAGEMLRPVTAEVVGAVRLEKA